MTNQFLAPWPSERLESFRSLWSAGTSVTQICELLGLTRGQVSGARTRYQLPKRRTGNKMGEGRHEARWTFGAQGKQFIERKTRTPTVPMPVPLKKSIIELEDDECRYAVEGEGRHMKFCGHLVTDGEQSRWCEYHHQLATVKTRSLIDEKEGIEEGRGEGLLTLDDDDPADRYTLSRALAVYTLP